MLITAMKVLNGFRDVFPLVRSGGIIAFHDIITAKGVENFWNEIKKQL